jgi:AraC-like DNA-binding protein
LDVLSSVLRELKFEAAAYRLLALTAPWRVGFGQRGVRGIHIVLDGRCELVVADGTVVPLQAGDLVVLPRADPHELRSAGERRAPLVPSAELDASRQGGRIRAGGGGEATSVLCGAFLFGEPGHPALGGLPRLVHVAGDSGRAPGWLAAYVEVLSDAALEGGPGSELVMARLSDALVAQALRFHAEHADDPGWLRGLRDPYVAKALAALHDDLGHPWTLDSLARTAGLSRSAFAARFTAMVGEPPMRYLHDRRMQRAMTILRDERATLERVAARVGYGSEAALSAAFKRHTGRAPGAYRREARRPAELDTRG